VDFSIGDERSGLVTPPRRRRARLGLELAAGPLLGSTQKIERASAGPLLGFTLMLLGFAGHDASRARERNGRLGWAGWVEFDPWPIEN
jgi:hypothetical protein